MFLEDEILKSDVILHEAKDYILIDDLGEIGILCYDDANEVVVKYKTEFKDYGVYEKFPEIKVHVAKYELQGK